MENSRSSFLRVSGTATIAPAIGVMVLAWRSAAAVQSGSAPGSFLDVEGGKVHYEECGPGDEAVLLVHDGVVHSAVWADGWAGFCKSFHAIRYDRRGYGRSPVATSWYTETDDIFALLRHLNIRRVMLVGSSHGGELSIEFVLEHPDLVEKLVLVGAVVHGYSYSDHFMNRGIATWSLFEKNNLAAAITRIASDKYLKATDHPAAGTDPTCRQMDKAEVQNVWMVLIEEFQ